MRFLFFLFTLFAGSLTTAGLVAISFVSWNSGEAVQAAVSGFLFLSITGIAVSTGRPRAASTRR